MANYEEIYILLLFILQILLNNNNDIHEFIYELSNKFIFLLARYYRRALFSFLLFTF